MQNDPKALTEAAIRKVGSLHQLAEQLHVTVQTIVDWHTGKQIPQADHMAQMRRIVAVPR